MPRRFGDFIEAIGCGCRCRFVKVISRQASVYKNDTKKGTYVTIICQSDALLTIADTLKEKEFDNHPRVGTQVNSALGQIFVTYLSSLPHQTSDFSFFLQQNMIV